MAKQGRRTTQAAPAVPKAAEEPPKKPAVKKRARKPVKKKPATKPPPAVEVQPFGPLLVFTDLHVNGERLEDALAVLDQVGELAEHHKATPVCLGDFWHLRGHYMVRHVEEVLRRLEAWTSGVFIPGNHDQVTVDGSVHGLNFLRSLEQFDVVTEALLNEKTRTAFLPWRENPEEQRALFAALPDGAPWTVFAHAEVGGALANSGYKTPGHVQLADIEAKARACYLGHYHKRQQLGDRTWYIGSPYQQNMGERDWPHGVAIVTHETPEPAFIELSGFRQYWRLDAKDGSWDPSLIKAGDVVELQMPAEMVGTEEHHAIREQLGTDDVRVVPSREALGDGAPAFALTLDSAVEAWAQQAFKEEFEESGVATAQELIDVGRSLLGEVPEARTIPVLGPKVKLLNIELRDFCALRGELSFPISQYRRLLLEAPIATGKTALLDAPMWCLYGETTPRKPGQAGAQLRADGVINDNAADCYVECVFEVGEHKITIRREKKRGSGAKVKIEGIDYPDGISDQDQLIQHVVGLDHSLWRACVSLGQGAVANFATDADKRRKDLLSAAFGLSACEAAAKVAKKRRDDAKQDADNHYRQLTAFRASLATLRDQDFSQQSAAWEQQKQGALVAAQQQLTQAQQTMSECDGLLQGQAAWRTHKADYQQHVDHLTKQLVHLQPANRVGELQRQYGSLESELAQAKKDENIALQEWQQLASGGQSPPCPQCGQALPPPTVEQYYQAAEAKHRGAQEQIRTIQHRMANVAAELHTLNEGGSAQRQSVEAQIDEARTMLAQCDNALEQFARIQSNRDTAEALATEMQRRITEQQAAANPFQARIQEMQQEAAALEAKISAENTEFETATARQVTYAAWVTGFGAKGIPALVLRTALMDLEQLANRYLADLLDGTVYCQLLMEGDSLQISYFETKDGVTRERTYEQLSGGQRRCVELAFTPLALSDMIFARVGVRIGLLMVDELTTHMGANEKMRAAAILERLDRDIVLVVDHDVSVQGHFDHRATMQATEEGMRISAA